MRYVIGTGWYCPDQKGYVRDGHGSAFSRSLDFWRIWEEMLFKYVNPVKTIMVDSASPVPPPYNSDIEVIGLDRNYHNVDGRVFNGWTRGFLTGMLYAWNCDSDFIYVEQDLLVKGKGWVEAIYANAGARRRYQVLSPKNAMGSVPWKIQQSLIFVPKELIPAFFSGIAAKTNTTIAEQQMCNGAPFYKELPFGCGRIRPIDWDAEYLALQHMTNREIRQMCLFEGIDFEKYGLTDDLLDL